MQVKYSDINLFAGKGKPSALVYGEESINQNILLILLTPVRSAWFAPTIGSSIPELLFDPIDDKTALRIKREVLGLLPRNAETRVTISEVIVMANPVAQDFYVSIRYYAPDLKADLITFNFNISR